MKLVEIKCPSCGGTIKMDDPHSQLITCEYCGSQFYREEEKKPEVQYHTVYRQPPSSASPVKAIVCFVGVLFVMLFIIGRSTNPTRSSSPAKYGYSGNHNVESSYTRPADPAPSYSALYQSLLKDVFDASPANVSAADLARIKYLKIKCTHNLDTVWYSFDDPYSTTDPEIHMLSYPTDRSDWNPKDLTNFTGITRLDTISRLNEQTDLTKLTQLKGIATEYMELAEVIKMIPDPSQLLDLSLSDITTLEGIASFSNLETLELHDMSGCDLKQLVTLKNLRSLIIEDSSGNPRVTDYTPIAALKTLETLSLESDIIRDVSFVRELPALTTLSLNDLAIVNLAPLAEFSQLSSLTVIDNYEIDNYDAIATLTNLKELTIDKLTNQADPDLSSLESLEMLNISGFMSLSTIRNKPHLKELFIHGCNASGAESLSALTDVERLTFYNVWGNAGKVHNINFISGMTGLKYANFNGSSGRDDGFGFHAILEVYGDVSPVFNLPQLEELHLDNGNFEINFDNIKENSALKILGIRNLTLNKNYYVQSQGGMTSVWYDEVSLPEHLDFLLKFPNLEELYLDSNKLTDISFAAELKTLKVLSLQDNYITDLSPLSQHEFLEVLDVIDNPVPEGAEKGYTRR